MTTVKDMLGNELKAGDLIVYPGRSGSSLWMNTARFIEATEDGKLKVMKLQQNGRGDKSESRQTLEGTRRVVKAFVVLPTPGLRSWAPAQPAAEALFLAAIVDQSAKAFESVCRDPDCQRCEEQQ